MTTDITPTPAPAPNTPGRKRKLDDTKRREVCALISAGCSLADAALYVRCDVATIYREAQRNAEFHDQLRDAEMCAQLNPLQAMQKAIGTHWRAAAWFLERAYPERFARRDPYALSPRQARKLMKDVLEVIAEETGHSKLGELLEQRIRPVFENAILTARDSRRTGRGLREAIRYFSQKARKNDNLRDLPEEFEPPQLDHDAPLAWLDEPSAPIHQRQTSSPTPDDEPPLSPPTTSSFLTYPLLTTPFPETLSQSATNSTHSARKMP